MVPCQHARNQLYGNPWLTLSLPATSRCHGPDGNDDDVAVGARASGVNTVALIYSLGESSVRWNQTGFGAFPSAESAGHPD